MSLFYDIPWDELEESKDVAHHAVEEAYKFIQEGRIGYATTGGPGLFKATETAQLYNELGIEVLQVAGCEVFVDVQDIWCGVFNGIMFQHSKTGWAVKETHLWTIIHRMSNDELRELIKS